MKTEAKILCASTRRIFVLDKHITAEKLYLDSQNITQGSENCLMHRAVKGGHVCAYMQVQIY